MNQPRTLLPIGTRVTHFHGGGHGKGTIVAYNGVSPNNYIRNNFKDAVEMASKAGLAEALVTAMYDGQRYPYVVHFDPVVEKEGESSFTADIRTKYPRGYKDVYEIDSVFPLEPNENIFPHPRAQFVLRRWSEERKEWDAWSEASGLQYMTYKDHPDFEAVVNPVFEVKTNHFNEMEDLFNFVRDYAVEHNDQRLHGQAQASFDMRAANRLKRYRSQIWGSQLEQLQKKENDGRGVQAARDVATCLSNHEINDAVVTAHNHWDKIRNYPAIAGFLRKIGVAQPNW